uniref:Uncharacterized protein n=1 Tax=Leptobrachium leishanense TaxID=445787 RepID=A0A8C5R0U9_9ANUR
VKIQQLEIKLINKTEEDVKKARRKSTQAGVNVRRCDYNQAQSKWFEEMVTTTLVSFLLIHLSDATQPLEKYCRMLDLLCDIELGLEVRTLWRQLEGGCRHLIHCMWI